MYIFLFDIGFNFDFIILIDFKVDKLYCIAPSLMF